MSSMESQVGFSKTARRTFHDVPYVLIVSGDGEGLAIEVERAEDGQRWRSKFAARFIEEITQRTGNAKKFDIFVRMLLSALNQESDAVYLDVLTARDLEMLRRHANPQGPPTTSMAGQSDKRYLILTYRAEFDKVHYPLPLPLEERSEEETLRAMVSRLRGELAEARGQSSAGSVASFVQEQPKSLLSPVREDDRVVLLQRQNAELTEALRASQREVEALSAELRTLTTRASVPSRPMSAAGEQVELQRQREKIRSLQAEVKSLTDQCKEKDLRAKRGAEASARELRNEKQKVERAQQQIRRLEEERRTALRSSGGRAPSAERSRPASRSASAERARPPSRPTSGPRAPPASAGAPNGLPAGGRSRQPSRASSVASSRERTPSPSAFLRGGAGAGGPRRASPAPAERPKALGRSSSPGGFRQGRRAPSPSATLSPYRQPLGAADARRTPSPGQRSGRLERNPQAPNHLPAVGTAPRVPVSLRDRGPGHAAADAGAGGRQKPPSSRYDKERPGGGGLTRSGSASRGLRSGSAGRNSFDSNSDREGQGPGHQPGSLFGLAAELGITSQGAAVGTPAAGRQQAVGAAAGAAPPASAEDVDASDIDARLQALQSFLKQTKGLGG